ncbi:MAG: PilN domain-containing protein [Burkholderiales bacterium]
MILINLLPHREAARKRRRDGFQMALLASVAAGAAIAGGVYLWYQGQIEDQQGRNTYLQSELKKVDEQIKEIALIESEITALRARQKAVEDLQADRNLPVHLLNEVSKQLPDGVYLTALKQQDQSVSIQGVAQSNERVSELLRALAANTPWLAKPELVDITSSTLSLTPRDQRRVSNFNVKFNLKRSAEPDGKTVTPTSQANAGSAAATSVVAAAVRK